MISCLLIFREPLDQIFYLSAFSRSKKSRKGRASNGGNRCWNGVGLGFTETNPREATEGPANFVFISTGDQSVPIL